MSGLVADRQLLIHYWVFTRFLSNSF